MGYKVIEEDEWDFEALHDILLEGFLKDLVVVQALNPRYASHGVRTGSMLPVCIKRRSRQKARKFITSLSLPSILWRTSTELIS